MELKSIQIGVFDWDIFSRGANDVLDQEKDPDDCAYNTYYGVNVRTGLPCWFVSNLDYTVGGHVKPRMVVQALAEYAYTVPTGMICNPDENQFYKFSSSYLDLYDRCGGFDDPKKIYNAFRENHANKCHGEAKKLMSFYETSPFFVFHYTNPLVHHLPQP